MPFILFLSFLVFSWNNKEFDKLLFKLRDNFGEKLGYISIFFIFII